MPVELADDQIEMSAAINDPGVVRSVAWCPKPKLVLRHGQPEFDEVLTIFVEVSPNGPRRNRRFLIIPTGKTINVPDGTEVLFIGTALSAHSPRVAHVYEVKALS